MSKKNKKKKVEEKEQTKSAVETNCKEIKEQDQTINNEKECNKNVYKLEGIINFTDFFEQIIDQNLLKYLKKEIENDRPDCLNIIINSLQPIEKQFFPDLRKKDDNFKRNLLEKIDRQITKLEIMQGFVTNFGTYVDYQYEHYDYLNLNKKKIIKSVGKADI